MIWTLTIPGRPESINTFMKKVPMARAALKKPWRERATDIGFRILAEEYPFRASAHRDRMVAKRCDTTILDKVLADFGVDPSTAAGAVTMPYVVRAIHVTFQPHLRGKRRQDVGACLLPAKACVDGLVDAGWMPDDSDEYVVGLTFRPAVYECDEDSLVMTIEEVEQ